MTAVVLAIQQQIQFGDCGILQREADTVALLFGEDDLVRQTVLLQPLLHPIHIVLHGAFGDAHLIRQALKRDISILPEQL